MAHNQTREEVLRSSSGNHEVHGKVKIGDSKKPSQRLLISVRQKDEAKEKSPRNSQHDRVYGKVQEKEIIHGEDERELLQLSSRVLEGKKVSLGGSDMDDQQDGATEIVSDNFAELKGNVTPVCALLEQETPFRPHPASSDMMKVIKISKRFSIQPKKFDPETYIEEDEFVTEKSFVRWREVTNPDGTVTHESNASFVKWSDGSLQLIIGKEALDVVEVEMQGIQQLFFHKEKGILKCQGRLRHKLIVAPTTFPSNSQQSLPASIQIPQRKIPKVKPAPESLIKRGMGNAEKSKEQE